ncbi:helix-turn-helix domain-containing protein [Prauserella flavalba]|uniref:helix-turn-helix domain-containing protein n=1 Tax=Prauserella flavalba TaxID=1477506 RepID=UPI0036EC4F34
MGTELPEPAAVVQVWLNHHMGSSAPTIVAREDQSLFIESESGPLEACALPLGKPADGSPQQGQLFCMNSAGERRYYRAPVDAAAVVIASKPAGDVVWRYERWQDGALDLVTDSHSAAFNSPGASDPEVDEALLRWLWPQTFKVSDDDLVQRLGVSMRTARRRAVEAGLPSRRFDAQRADWGKDVLAELWADPTLTKRAICQRLGVSDSELAGLARRWELPARPRVRKKADRPTRSSPRKKPTRTGGNAALLREANRLRTQTAAEPMLERTRAALDLPESEVPRQLRAAGELRVAHPQASLAELAELAGCSKDTMTGRLRRLWQLADRPQPRRASV